MNPVWILVTWDETMPFTRQFEDETDAVEALKDARPVMRHATLLKVTACGAEQVEGW